MKKFILIGAAIIGSFTQGTANADIVTASGITGSFTSATGTLSALFNSSFNANYTFGTSTSEASDYTLTPVQLPGSAVFSSRYDFSGGSFGGSASSNGNTLSSGTVQVNIFDNEVVTAAQATQMANLNAQPGTYNVFDVEISNASGVCLLSSCPTTWSQNTASGLNIDLKFIMPTTWVNGGVIPNPLNLSSAIAEYVQAQQYDANGNVIGNATGLVSNINISSNVSSVPVPGALWLFGSALAGFFGLNRRKLV